MYENAIFLGLLVQLVSYSENGLATKIFALAVRCIDIRTLHDCPSQMNENLLISHSKLTSDSELIWWR